MPTVRIYHNPRCSKSRATLALLTQRGVDADVVDYLQDPPDAATIRQLLALLGMAPRELLRKGEEAYRERGLADPALGDEDLIAAMVAQPKLIERPIVVAGDKAVIGRPPEAVLAIL
jgi:arsenate reductase